MVSKVLRCFVVGVATVFVMFWLAPSKTVNAQTTVTITQPSGTTSQAEDLDYVTHEWHDAWDMNEETDLHIFRSPTCDNQLLYNNVSFSSGIWSANYNLANTTDPWIWLLDPGYANALHVGKDGNVYPIDATYYTQLTFRMYLGPSFTSTNTPGAKIIWTNSDSSAITSRPAEFGMTKFFRVFPGWNIYTVDLSQIGLQQGSLAWGGNITGLRLYTGLNNSNAPITDVKIDWVRLTAKQNHTVAWTGSWSGGSTAQLYFSSDNVTFDPFYSFINSDASSGIIKPESISAGSSPSGSYSVPASFMPGNTYVEVSINSVTSNSGGPWQFIVRPDFAFTVPSYTSGPDFATNVVGNAWDMQSSADLRSWSNLTSAPSFGSNGLTGTSTNIPPNCGLPWGDPELVLNLGGQTINTNYYRYFTVKIKIDAPFDFGNGWVSRIYWALNNYNTFGGSNDMPLYDGWNVFNVDMWGNVQDETNPGNLPWRSGSPNILRFDPHEIPPSTQFQIEYIKLTANDYVSTNSVFPVRYQLANPSATVQLFYSTSRTTGSPRTPATAASSGSPGSSHGTYNLFLPMLFKNYASSVPPGTIFNWSTTGVAPGTYYVSADVTDGYATTTWYSETPVIVQ